MKVIMGVSQFNSIHLIHFIPKEIDMSHEIHFLTRLSLASVMTYYFLDVINEVEIDTEKFNTFYVDKAYSDKGFMKTYVEPNEREHRVSGIKKLLNDFYVVDLVRAEVGEENALFLFKRNGIEIFTTIPTSKEAEIIKNAIEFSKKQGDDIEEFFNKIRK